MKKYSDIIAYLKRDLTLYCAIKNSKSEVKPHLNIDIYYFLLSSIVSQQLSTKVAEIIFNRFIDLFPERYPKASLLIEMEDIILRGVGLSNNKVKYIKNVAKFSIQNEIGFDYMHGLSDEKIISYLTQIKGVGIWTVQMILMFPMDRQNVFPVDDLGIQKGMKKLYDLDLDKKELKIKLEEIAMNWHPYKTLACKYIWKISD